VSAVPDITYEVRITGPVPDEALEDLGEVTVATAAATTVISGSVVDQAALLGLLARLRAHGLLIAEVRRVPGAADAAPSADQA
jgi:hypothetical protein